MNNLLSNNTKGIFYPKNKISFFQVYSIETGEHEIRKTMGQHNTSALYDAVRLKYVFIFSFFTKT